MPLLRLPYGYAGKMYGMRKCEISTKGFGTEQVETELKALFPKANIGQDGPGHDTGESMLMKILFRLLKITRPIFL